VYWFVGSVRASTRSAGVLAEAARFSVRRATRDAGQRGRAHPQRQCAGDDVAGLTRWPSAKRSRWWWWGPSCRDLGLVDALAEKGISAFGPSRAAAQLEGSKAFMKRFLKRHAIPTADFAIFDDVNAAEAYVRAARARWW